MSFPYPQDGHRDRTEKGEHPYKDAKEAFARSEAELEAEAESYGETKTAETAEERARRLALEAEIRLREVGEEVRKAADK